MTQTQISSQVTEQNDRTDLPVEELIEAHDAFRAECGLERTRPDTRGSFRADVSLPGLGHDLRQVTGEVQRTQ